LVTSEFEFLRELKDDGEIGYEIYTNPALFEPQCHCLYHQQS
jgi:hypothetical protein